MAKLEALTNSRAVPDETMPGGYGIEPHLSAHSGWEMVEEW